MKSKDLQSNFTTPEQSLKLLEMGFSASTADCFRESEKHNDGKITYREAKEINEYEQFMNDVSYENAAVIPSWSVGRLMEIIDNCKICEYKNWEGIVYPSIKKVKQDLGFTYIEFLIQSIGCAIDVLDFSKLN